MNDQSHLKRHVACIEQMIADMKSEGLAETACLLEMVRLDLVSRIYGISADELDTLLFVARSGQSIRETPANGVRARRRSVETR